MDSPLSPIVVNLFMEDFESKSLAFVQFKPKLWIQSFVDDTCVIWRLGWDKLGLFLQHHNNQYSSTKFTMEFEVNKCLPFLDVLISSKDDGTFSHQVFCKKTHTK